MSLQFLFAAAVLWPAALLAAPVDSVNPAYAGADVPPLVYESAFTSYQRMPDAPQTPDKLWKKANETVGRIGGHAGYLRDEAETQEGAALPDALPAAQPAALPAAKPLHVH